MPLCIKGKFYAKVVVVYIMTAFYAIEFGVKSPCEEKSCLLNSQGLFLAADR